MANEKWDLKDSLWLVASRNPEAIRDLEQKLGTSQAEVVDAFIEETMWGRELPEYVGHHGTPEERIKVLRNILTRLPLPELASAMREPS
jgi:hypothetical protein